MSWLPLSFGAPYVLWGLAALPVIWWLLRLTPPLPQREVFAPLKILARLSAREETPRRSPWWLTLLRLVMAALVVLALADPIFKPREQLTPEGGALALVIDNGWASAIDWDRRQATAERLIDDAAAAGVPVLLAFTGEKPSADPGPFDPDQARDRLRATGPRATPVDRPAVYARAAAILQAFPGASVAVLSDGLAAEGDAQAFKTLLGHNPSRLIWIAPDQLALTGLTATDNAVDGFSLTAIRAAGDTAARDIVAGAFDDRGRRIAEAAISFGLGETSATGRMAVPFELRNDFATIAIDGEPQAAAIRVLDDSSKRRRVGLLSRVDADQAQPLLAPLYYLRRALEPFADLIEPRDADLARAIPQLLEQNPAMIIMADIGAIPPTARRQLIEWLHDGGTLVRFAGPHLAAAGNDEELLPVRLRLGERSLGGALSWTTPQPVSDFPATGPFAGLPTPRDVTVSHQILAEPAPGIHERTWAVLADGTPLVTGAYRENGAVVLFHVTPQAGWSNLPISGSFVEMLRRLMRISRNQGPQAEGGGEGSAALPPYRMIAANGTLQMPPHDARPLLPGPHARVTIENPPGLYGDENGVIAHNLLPADAVLTPIAAPQTATPMIPMSYAFDQSQHLKGFLLAATLLALSLDGLAVLWIGGIIPRRRANTARVGATAAVVVAAACLIGLNPHRAAAQDARPSDSTAIEAISVTRLAYVLTGDDTVDAISRAGLSGLSRFLAAKTALEPGQPVGVDIASDELAFFPILYWPIDTAAAMPSEEAIARVDAYMKHGGTVLFDTRDQFSSGLDGSLSPQTARLREILDTLNVPPLEPVPHDHVLTKSFFILPEFPGRFSGSPLWVEASLDATNIDNRPVRTGDGVSPIMITANDFAGAWAMDEAGNPMLPTIPADPMQRIYSLRAGVNIVMYMLTGNYKSDQVHVPILLERLGQ